MPVGSGPAPGRPAIAEAPVPLVPGDAAPGEVSPTTTGISDVDPIPELTPRPSDETR
jgi:hypothetical protein